MIEKLLEYGLAGAVIALVFLFVVGPMMRALVARIADLVHTLTTQVDKGNEHVEAAIKEITATRLERQEMCQRHQQNDIETLASLKNLSAGFEVLVRRANGGKMP